MHPLLFRSVAQALQAIFLDNRYADKVIESALRNNPKAGSRDRSFIAETTYEVVRHYRLYETLLGRQPRSEADFWQMAAIHQIVQGAREEHLSRQDDSGHDFRLPDWKELKGLNPATIIKRLEKYEEQRPIRESIPDWLDALGQQELPEQWDATLHWLNQPASVVLRTNTLKTSRAALQKALADEGIETKAAGDADALVLTQRKNVFQTKAFKSGHFEVQDYSSQLVAPMLAPQPGQRVVDACAGGGGKTLHLAALLKNKGSLIALDTLRWKLDELKIRARRAGVSNIETRPIENRKTIKRLYGTADRLLLDVPCSGLGVIRRNPDTKWKLQPAQIEQLRATQQEILQQYSPILKTGGRMVYATCSILPSENEKQVETFLNSPAGKDFHLIESRSILPQDAGFDGFYMAALERK